jgi:PHP family Zn ribbon phosphoesterase
MENLEFLCPNCHSQTKTYSGKKNIVNYKCECGKKIIKGSSKCVECNNLSQRKINRPSYQDLINEINNLGYVKTGLKYGVSDNAIRKWLKKYKNTV